MLQARSDGHTVIVFPGMFASDSSTFVIRAFLRLPGYRARGWGLGRNRGFQLERLEESAARVERAFSRSGRPVSLVGWSLGGIYARAVARGNPTAVRCVITLGSPIQANPRSRVPPPVPSTAIYSEEDEIVAPELAVETPGPRRESIRVSGGHMTLGFNRLVLRVIADRLAQDPKRWTPFSGFRGVRRGIAIA